MTSTVDLAMQIGPTAACASMGVARATYYRAQKTIPPKSVRAPRRSPLALSEVERLKILDILHLPEYIDVAPHTVYAMLLDDGVYLGSVSTFYRILREHSETMPRRNEKNAPSILASRVACD